MASQGQSNSFEAIIHADRQRKKNEDLANEIFGRSKTKQNVPKKQQKERTPSLASRMGIQKRSSSSNTPTQKSTFNPPSRPSSTTPSHRNSQTSARVSRIASEIDSGTNTNLTHASSRTKSFTDDRNGAPSSGFTIKGSAGPFTLLASNFAPGTTEADIEAALHAELFDESEMVLTEKSVADRIVSKFNNLKADGRILKVTISKSGADGLNSSRRGASDRDRNDHVVATTIEPVNVMSDVTTGTIPVSVDADMDVDDAEIPVDYAAPTPYDHDREAADRDRLNRDRDRDGYSTARRGEDTRRDVDRPRDDRDRRRDDRERDREREPERDRDRERDRERDRRDFDRRESFDGRQQRAPPPAYGNGFNGPFQRGGYGGYGGRGNYGYGGRGGYIPRGGYRGGFAR